ncbi:replication-relaxation family protein [Bacillus kwashiorkori]|uniref:replication-relaxation family protein n=1 Tax=Bacillus kwashiorkori TaxID=1522318 RepID=UPI000783D3EA|nr:replication-relaxation family protein [Bacillus kwashiorkori]
MQDKIVLKKNARQRLELTKSDLKLLVFLEQQRMLTLKQLYQAAKHLIEMNITEYSFKNRIRKFEDYQLIRGEHYSEGFNGERFKFLCIGSKAVDLLIENNLLDSTYNKPKIYKFNQKKNLMHFLFTQQAAINILTYLNTEVVRDPNTDEIKYSILYDLTSFSHSPATFPYTEWIKKDKNLHRQNNGAYHAKVAKYMTVNKTGTKINGATMTIVKPDWIIELKGSRKSRDAIINIELDMGTEPIETLVQKVFKYAILAKKNPDVLHIMNIVIADNSFSNRSTLNNGIKRRENIMKQFASDAAVANLAIQSGLKVVVSILEQNDETIYKALRKY